MSASINFFSAGYGFNTGSGLGFYGSSFGQSIAVGSYQDSTYITDSNGVIQGPQSNNVKWIHPNSGLVNGTTTLALNKIPNYQGTLEIRFTNSTPVITSNAQLYIYDRVSTLNPPTGVTIAAAKLIHPSIDQSVIGSGNSSFEFPAGSSYMNMSVLSNGSSWSPGNSGQGINPSTDHSFFCLLSASPNSIGSKSQVGLFFQVNYA